MQLEVSNCLPHTAPMLMVSEILCYTDDSIEGLSRITADNPLLEAGQFPCMGAVELFAQIAGILFGIRNIKYKTGSSSGIAISNKPPRGAVVQIKGFELGDVDIQVGAELKIQANFLGGNEQAAKISGTVYFREKRVFEGALMIALFEGETK